MIEVRNLDHTYGNGSSAVKALSEVELSVERGELLALSGRSGSGKSTLLMILGGLLRPDSGAVRVGGEDLFALDARRRAEFRAAHIGFVFQLFHLVPYLDVVNNVLLAKGPGRRAEREVRARQLLDRLGMTSRTLHLPEALSAGEKQRTALARALMDGPQVLLADEPTGNLDAENTRIVMDALAAFAQSGGTVVLATHDRDALARATRRVALEEGRCVEVPR